jgi:hypothetical protein
VAVIAHPVAAQGKQAPLLLKSDKPRSLSMLSSLGSDGIELETALQ